MNDFADRDSVVRRIWGNGDMVLLVFAGSAAEFALNRAVDWLFFTGELPRDPIGRLFSTAGYSQHIVFADEATAARTLERIRLVHEAVERERGQNIPEWAHRDVLYMLIDYSERAHEVLAGPLTADEQEDLYDVFRRVGLGLGVKALPLTYAEWRVDREIHLHRDLVHGDGTAALYAQYRRQLGAWRYQLLLRLQALLVPAHVRGLLHLKSAESLRPLTRLYPLFIRSGLRSAFQWLLMPAEHLEAVRALDRPNGPAHASTKTATAAAGPHRRRTRAARAARRFGAGLFARAGLLSVALCVAGTAPARAQAWGIPADWAAFAGGGVSHIDTDALDEHLNARGLPAFGQTAGSLAIVAGGRR